MNFPTLLTGGGLLGAFLLISGAYYFRPASISPPPSQTQLSVPYVSQVPNDAWVLPWSQACEEASIAMVDGYYRSKTNIDRAESKRFIEELIAWENQTLKKNEDTNAEETLQIIKQHGSFSGSIERNPSIDSIKQELAASQPVIALVDMYDLYKEARQKDGYHVVVIAGYDDTKQEFLVKDPAREQQTWYSYDILMGALHDYDDETHEATGSPTVIFTRR